MSSIPDLRRSLATVGLVTAALLSSAVRADAATAARVVEHYADMGHAVYSDSLRTAEQLDRAVDRFLEQPTAARLAIAREAWKAARVPYGQSEIYRFGNPPVDAWEGQVNAWPLDEGLIDYVVGGSPYEASQGNEAARANVVANAELQVYGRTIDAGTIDVELLRSLHELGGSEANVGTGYHAIEFLLWGRDHNGTPTASGQRPASDFRADGDCTSGAGNAAPAQVCERRAAYLRAASDLLVSDLEAMVAQWAPDRDDNYRARLLAEKPAEGLRRMMRGMGAMAGGELSNERMRVALIAHAQEDEHSCFSDNTHVDIAENARGMRNVWFGEYRRVDGRVVEGPSLNDLVNASAPELAARLRASLDRTMRAVHRIEVAALLGEPFDQQIRLGNGEGAKRIGTAIESLSDATDLMVKAAATVGIEDLNTAL